MNKCLILFFAGSFSIAWAQRATITQLMQDADAIVVGVAQGVTETALGFDTQIQVLRTLKGSPEPGMPIRIQLSRQGWRTQPSPMTGCGNPCVLFLRDRTTGVFFLQANAASWTPLEVRHGCGVVPGCFLDSLIPAADKLSSSASAWLSSLSAATKAEERIEDLFLAEVLTAVEARVQGTWDVLNDLGQFDNRSVVPVLKIARRSILPYEYMRDRALRVLLEHDDTESYSDLVRSGSSVRKSYEFRSYIEAVCYTRSSSPAVIAGLRSVFDSPEMPIELRYAAASALAEIHTKPLLPLFEKWLFDPDPILRAYGAAGVGLFANGCGVSKRGHNGCFRDAEAPRPAYWVPELHEKQMNGFRASKHNVASAASWVAFWQDWWKKNSIFVLNDPRPR